MPQPPLDPASRDAVGRVRRLRTLTAGGRTGSDTGAVTGAGMGTVTGAGIGAAGWVPGAPDIPRGPADDVAVGDFDGEAAADPAGAADAPASAPARAGRSAWATRLVRSGPWGALAEKWVPETLRDARVDPGRRGAALLSVVAALAAVIAAVGVWWSKPEPTPVGATAVTSIAAPSPAGTPSLTGAPTAADSGTGVAEHDVTSGASPPVASTSAAPTGPILVSVTGRVRHPGLVTVPADARVADAIAAAGGVLDAADLTGLNLAAHVSDGASVVVAGPGGSSVQSEMSVDPDSAGGAGSGAGAGPDTVDINSADLQVLQQLPGVGPVTAGAIVEYRTQHGPFTDVAQLQEVSGIGPVTFARIAPHVTL